MPLQAASFTQLAFDGMRDSLDPQTGQPRKAKLIQNCYPVDPQFGGGLTGRPGLTVSQNVQLGQSGHRNLQAVYQFTTLAGTEYTIVFVGGLMYTYNWGANTWTNVPLVGVAIPLDSPVYCLTFNNKLIVNPSDGGNLPWSWDGTTFASLTNAPLFYGPLTAYDAHLVGIKWTERSTIDWSEANQENTGYESGGFNNSWTLKQTDPNALQAIYGTNEALYYWRARSMGRIVGSVTVSWSSTGTHDAVSLKTGTLSPGAITAYETDIFFLDSDGRPHVLQSGGGVIPIWQDYRNTLANVPRVTIGKSVAVSYTPVPLILLAVTELNQSIPNLILSLVPGGDEPVAGGLWRGWTLTSMGMVKNFDGAPTLLVGGTDGYVYQVGDPAGTIWDDKFVGQTLGIQHVVQGSYLGYHPKDAKQFDRLRVLLRGLTPNTNITVDYSSPEVTETLPSVTVTSGNLSLWDQMIWDSSAWSAIASEMVTEFGLQGLGRWLLPRITHQQVGERFGLDGWECDAFVIGAEPITV